MSCSRAWSPSSRCATAQASRCSKPWLMRPNGLPPYNRRFDQHPQLFKRPLQRRPPYIKRHRRSMANHFDLEEQERSEEHTSELQSPCNLVCRLLLEKKKNNIVDPDRK